MPGAIDWTETARSLHERADRTNDAADHDEMHAAGAMVEAWLGLPYNSEYINRWIAGVVARGNE